jgi:hypothetical protein
MSVVVLLGVYSASNAVTVPFSDDFEYNLAVGANLPEPPYHTDSRAPISAGGYGHNDSRAAELGAGGPGDYLILPIDPISEGYLRFYTAFWGTGDALPNQIGTVVGSTDQVLLAPISGHWHYLDNSGGGDVWVDTGVALNVGSYGPGRSFVEVIIAWNDTETLLFIDGTQVGGPGSANPNVTRFGTGVLGNVNKAQWLFNGATGQWVDDLTVAAGPIPEPVSLLLLAAGSLVAASRRRRG